MKNKGLKIFSLIGNILVFLSAIAGVAWYYATLPAEMYQKGPAYFYYTINSNIFVGLTSLLAIIGAIICLKRKEDVSKRALHVIKFVGVTCVTLTLVTVLYWLASGTFEAKALVEKFNIFLHFATPILAFLTFILFDHNEKKLKWVDTLLAILPTLIYGSVYLVLVAILNKQEYNVYLFGMKDGNFVWWMALLSFVTLLLVAFLIANVAFFLNKLFRKLTYKNPEPALDAHEEIFGVNVIDEQAEKEARDEAEKKRKEAEIEQVKEENRIEKETQKAKEKKAKNLAKRELNPQEKPKTAQKTSAPIDYKEGPRIYHISRSKKQEGMWQVKLASGEKAVKLFKTQKEAIDYAKSLVNSNGGSIRIHSVKGKIRK